MENNGELGFREPLIELINFFKWLSINCVVEDGSHLEDFVLVDDLMVKGNKPRKYSIEEVYKIYLKPATTGEVSKKEGK